MLGHMLLWDAAIRPIKGQRYATQHQAGSVREHGETQIRGVFSSPESTPVKSDKD